MSRPHFMPLLAPQPAQPGLGQRPARTAARAAARAVARVTGRARAADLTRRQVICLGISTPVEECQGTGLAEAILRRVLSCGCPVGTVILDLGPATAIDETACAALLAVHERLAAAGTRLRVAAGTRGMPACLADEAISQRLGRDAVHPSFRSAVLATYADLPGPGLVTGRVRTALEMVAETITSPPGITSLPGITAHSGVAAPGAGARAAGSPCPAVTRPAVTPPPVTPPPVTPPPVTPPAVTPAAGIITPPAGTGAA